MMEGYIKKEDAIMLLERMMATLPEAIRAKFATEMVKQIPSADAVEVVRCKDCTNRDAETMFCLGRGWPMSMVPDNGYCDKGRKEIT